MQDMLSDSAIPLSNSFFASLVLLVKIKDGSQRFCVEYRQLNAFVSKDKCIISIICELLDELQRATFFSKVDLRSR